MEKTPTQSKAGTILCPTCGVRFTPSSGNICPTCTVADVDITEGISREGVLHFCRFCKRFLRPPWVFCERESRDLLAICLKKIKGLNKLKLLDAGFVWTEPHSRRIKVRLTVSKELNSVSSIDQTVIVEFVQTYLQCDDCRKEFTPHTWIASVQVRQHVEHKKTFYFLEQVILKHNAHDKVLKVEEMKDGVDFHFKAAAHAQRFVDFLSSVLPVKVEQSKQLISHDESSNIFNHKYTYSVEIPKICREDLIIIPKKLAMELGGCGPFLLCWKVSSHLYLLDLATYRTVIMSGLQYFLYQNKMEILPVNKFKSRFEVMDCEPVRKKQNLNTTTTMLDDKLYRLTIRPLDTNQRSDLMIEVRCHLGDLEAGQIVEGVDLRYLNYFEWMNMNDFKGVDDVIITRKGKNPNKRRPFKLHRLEQDALDDKKRKKKVDKEAEEYEEFLNDVATDKEMRKGVKLFLNKETLEAEGKEEFEKLLDGIDRAELLHEEEADKPRRQIHSDEEEDNIVPDLIELQQKPIESEPSVHPTATPSDI